MTPISLGRQPAFVLPMPHRPMPWEFYSDTFEVASKVLC